MIARINEKAGIRCALTVTIALFTALSAALFGLPAFSQADCVTSKAELSSALQDDDAAVRTRAAECFVEQAVFFDYLELEDVVDTMLQDDAPGVRLYGLYALVASHWGGLTTASELANETTRAIQFLNEETVGRNIAAAAGLIGLMEPIPVDQAREPLLGLLSHPESPVVKAAFDTLLRFYEPPEQEMAQSLMGMTGHSDPKFRGLAYWGLGRLFMDHPGIPAEVVDLLAAALSDESRTVQWQAANSLRRFGVQAAAAEDDLQAIVWDPKQYPEVRDVAQEAVEAITGAPITPPWLSGTTPEAEPGLTGGPQ